METNMAAPNLSDDLPATWEGQLRTLLDQYVCFSTRADADSSLNRMATLAEHYATNHTAQEGFHTNIKQTLRTALQAYLERDKDAYTIILHIAKQADRQEAM